MRPAADAAAWRRGRRREAAHPASGTASAAATPPVGGPAASWAMVGRDAERAVVDRGARRRGGGHPGAVLVVGDPGTGKTRLVDAALAAGTAPGYGAAVGRCSQDDGAPPLWPWYALLDGLGIERPAELEPRRRRLPTSRARSGPSRCRTPSPARCATGPADTPVLLVVEDLHWADTRTLRALTHLVTTLARRRPGRPLATRRARPQPTGALADLGVALARHGARTLELGGLGRATTPRPWSPR